MYFCLVGFNPGRGCLMEEERLLRGVLPFSLILLSACALSAVLFGLCSLDRRTIGLALMKSLPPIGGSNLMRHLSYGVTFAYLLRARVCGDRSTT